MLAMLYFSCRHNGCVDKKGDNMNKTKLCDYSKEAQDHIKKEAERVGVSVDRVLENVDALSAGRGPVYRDPVFLKETMSTRSTNKQ